MYPRYYFQFFSISPSHTKIIYEIWTLQPPRNLHIKRKRGTVRIICFRGSGKPVVQDKTTPHANHVYNEYIYGKHERLYRQSPYHVKFTRFLKRDKAKRFLRTNMSPTNYFISTTNIVNFQRFTNVFRGVVEQIYIKLDTQQDFRQNTPMRSSNYLLPLLPATPLSPYPL